MNSTSINGPGAREPGTRTRRPSGRRLALVAVAVLAVVAIAAPMASAAPFRCDGTGYVTMYGGTVGNDTLLSKVVRQTDGTYAVVPIHRQAGELINAVGFRVQDGFMYAWRNQPGPPGLVRIEDDGAGGATFTPLPPVVGMPPGFGAFVGAFLADGTYFVFGTPSNPVGYVIDVSGPVPTMVTQVTPTWDASAAGLPIGDVAISPVDGNMYATLNGQVHQLILSGSTLSLGPVVGTGGPFSGGAQWFSPAGTQATLLQISSNPDGRAHLYATDMASGALTDLGALDQTPPNADGTSCANTLAVTKDASPRTVAAGGELTYTYTITAHGQVDNPVDFVDTLPAGMTYVPGGVTVNGTFGPTNAYGGTDTLSISGVIPHNTTVTIAARVRVAASAACDVDVPNQAQATMHAAGLPDVTIASDDPTTPTDLTDPTLVRVRCPVYDMQIVKTSDDRRVRVGETLTYTLSVRNNGPDAAPAGYVVRDTVPRQFDVLGVTGGGGADCSRDGRAVRCTLPAMAAGAELAVSVRVRAVSAGGTRNVAFVDPPPGGPQCTPTCDPPENNRDDAPVRVVKTRLALTKAVGRRTLRAGETTSYTIRVRNPSRVALRNVRTCDRLPAGLVYVSSNPRARLSSGRQCWTVRRLPAGASRTYRVKVRALRGTRGRLVNTATATSPDARRAQARRAVRVIAGEIAAGGVTG